MAFRAAATVLQRRFSVGAAFFDGRCNRCSSRVTTLSRQALTPFFSGPDDKRKTKQKKKHITNRCRPGQSRRNGGTRRHPASKDGVGRSKESEQRVINTKLSEPGPHLFWPDADTTTDRRKSSEMPSIPADPLTKSLPARRPHLFRITAVIGNERRRKRQ